MARIPASGAKMASKAGQGLYAVTLDIMRYSVVSLQCFIECIQTGEFMHVYNSIVVLKEVLDVFPLASVNDYGPAINAAINRLIEVEERRDLKVLALS